MLTIYHVPRTRSLRIIWLCEELGLDYDPVTIDFSADYRASDEWRAINPVGKVPALQDGDLTLFESGAMLEYLLTRYGEGRLRPAADDPNYPFYLQWCWFAEATFARPLGEIVNHQRVFSGAQVIPHALDEMADRAELCMQAVDQHLQETHPYLLGEVFSAADIMMGYSLNLAQSLIPERVPDGLAPYLTRLQARPAYQATAEL